MPKYLALNTLSLALALVACSKNVPEGQVVATVNGDEITRTQLNAALPAGNDGGNKDAGTVRNAVLDKLVMQRLVVQEAKRQGIDKSQDYLLASQRADDQILSELLSRKILQSLRTPYAKNVEQFVRDNPSRFANRVILAVDQIRYPAGRFDAATLKDAHSLDEVQRRLEAAKVRSEHGRAALDSAGLTSAFYNQLMALPPGEPFVVTENGITLVSVIVGRQAAPVEADTAKKLAMQVIQQDQSRAALLKQLETLRKNAQVEYQPGFTAPKPSIGAGPPSVSPGTVARPAPAAR